MKQPRVTAAGAIRKAAGLTAAEVAKKVPISANYLLASEWKQRFPYYLAHRPSHLYGCRLDDFLPVLAPAEEAEPPSRQTEKPPRKPGVAR